MLTQCPAYGRSSKKWHVSPLYCVGSVDVGVIRETETLRGVGSCRKSVLRHDKKVKTEL